MRKRNTWPTQRKLSHTRWVTSRGRARVKMVSSQSYKYLTAQHRTNHASQPRHEPPGAVLLWLCYDWSVRVCCYMSGSMPREAK